MADDFERAILISFNPSMDPNLKVRCCGHISCEVVWSSTRGSGGQLHRTRTLDVQCCHVINGDSLIYDDSS